MTALRYQIPASPLGTQPCLALQNNPRPSIMALPAFPTAVCVFLSRGSRLTALAARLSMRFGNAQAGALIRPSLGLFPFPGAALAVWATGASVSGEGGREKTNKGWGPWPGFIRVTASANVASRLGSLLRAQRGSNSIPVPSSYMCRVMAQ